MMLETFIFDSPSKASSTERTFIGVPCIEKVYGSPSAHIPAHTTEILRAIVNQNEKKAFLFTQRK